MKESIDNMMQSQYLPKQSRSVLVRYLRFGRLMKKNCDTLPLLESFDDGREKGRRGRSSGYGIWLARYFMLLEVILLYH